jgi:bacitracin synthase 3
VISAPGSLRSEKEAEVGTSAAQSVAERYWLDKLGSFRHASAVLPSMTHTSDESSDTGPVVVPAPATDDAGIEELCVAAFALVVSRYNGGEPLLIAAPVDGASEVVRFLACTCDEQQDGRTFLEHVRVEVEESGRHPPCVLARAAAGLGLDAATFEQTLLQLAYAVGPAADAGLLWERAGLGMRVERHGAELRLHVGDRAHPPWLARQLAAHVARAIEWLAANDRRPLSEFELLSVDERRCVGSSFNDTHVPVPEGLTLHGLIAAQTTRAPDTVAVVFRDVELTYRTLDQQANQIAAVLRRDFHVTNGGIVGVMMERSEKTVAALYGVMKAGAAYVPINPRHPWDTVRYMLENASISVLIVDSESIAAAASFSGELFVVDLELPGAAAAPDPGVPVADSDLAYVIYTSGSTGRPKGVAIEHRAIVNTVLWRNAFYAIGSADVNLQVPSFAFDSSVVDIFCVLTAGGTLVIPDEDLRLDARGLIALSVARGVTSCIVTPSYYKLLVTELGGAVPSLRWITLAGESATPELVAAHLKRMPGVALYNEYGPTENAVCSTACRLDTVEAVVPIGQPIANVKVFVLDREQRLCPIGVPGEVFLGGIGLARGYLNQDALTAERFVASPVPDFHEGRLYRTGDRACWRPDGAIDFLGRFDSQVKVRGFRIELDHVELALLRQPDVRHAAVLCKEDASGAKYLAAYAETRRGVGTAVLREHLRSQVPDYMVPDVLTIVPRLPLNLNGKVDRAELLAVDDFIGHQDSAEPAAMSPVEQMLLTLWAAVLQRSEVLLDDNFFALGGNSLRVMDLTSRLRDELSLHVDLIDIYTYPTVRELAERLSIAGEGQSHVSGR